MTVNFSLLALDQIVNNAATLRHMSGGQFNVPLVIRMATGAGRQLAAQHSHSLEGWYAHIPGLKVLAPGNGGGRPRDARAGAGRSGPGAHLRARQLYNTAGDVDDADGDGRHRPTPLSDAAGTDVTLITYGGVPVQGTRRRRRARRGRHRRGGDRPARPSPAGRRRDHRVGAARPTGPWSSTRGGAPAAWRPRSARASSSRRSYDLDAPVARVCSAEVPIPYANTSNRPPCRRPEKIVAAVNGLFGART